MEGGVLPPSREGKALSTKICRNIQSKGMSCALALLQALYFRDRG